MAIERTFSMIKPDATSRNLTGAITKMLEDAGLRVIASKRVLDERCAKPQGFYAVHKDRPFFGELVEFMSSAPTIVQVLEGENAIAQEPRSDGRHQPGKCCRRHDPQGSRALDRRKFGPRFGRAGNGCCKKSAYWFSGTEIVG